MSKNKPLADNEMENAAGGQIEQVNIHYTDMDGKDQVKTVYNVYNDKFLTKNNRPISEGVDLDTALKVAKAAGYSTKITRVLNSNRQGFSEEKLSKYSS